MNESKAPMASASQAGAANPSSSAGAKVTVACKLPNGYRMRVFDMIPGTELVMGGGVREIRQARLRGEVVLNGTAKRVEESYGCLVIGGYAMTPDVDKDLYEAWLAANRDEPIVRNNLIFAHENGRRVEGQAKEQAEVRSNLEPLNREPSADPRTPKGGPFKVEEGKRAA